VRVKATFPPLGDPNALPRRVLCLAPHADDEVLGCGGMLAFHAARGDDVRVLVLSDGAAGDPDGKAGVDLAEQRRDETRAAGGELGITDHRFLSLPDGAVGETPELVQRLRAEVDEFDPDLVYGPSPLECHPDHRSTSHALVAALAPGRARRVMLYGVNSPVTASVLFDTTGVWPRKRAAIERFASQLEYHDLVGKCEGWDRARTVNIPDPAVHVAEAFVDLDSSELVVYEGRAARLLRQVWGDDHGLDPAGSDPLDPEDPWAATAVISTWNKAEDVCANLDGLRAQTRPFARVVVVDNASSDDTVRVIAERYPEVNLIVMPDSAYGACETFNIGFASVTTPLLAILDDDVVLSPLWLEKSVERMRREPDSTAVVSTKIVEPGMPQSFIDSPEVNRERYMSTFRGCASLARRAALAEAGWYDERLFIYGNERDLTCRLLNLGYRVLQYPEVEAHHKTPFGMQMGKRSLFYHARNAWLSMLKYAPLGDLLRMPALVISKVLLRSGKKEAEPARDARRSARRGEGRAQRPRQRALLPPEPRAGAARGLRAAAEMTDPGAQVREIGPVSAVVCNYNGAGYLSACLDSILDQATGVDEVIVVDNGSEDASCELVRREYPDVRLVALEQNLGPCVARNVGMREARNRWVLAVDNDAILRVDTLGRLRATAERTPGAVVVQPRSVIATERDRVHYDGARFHYAGLLSLRNFYRALPEAEGSGVVPVDGAIAIALLMDRDVVLGVGGYDEDFFILFEDYDLSMRLRIAGHGIYSDEEALVDHRGGTPGISFRAGSYPKTRAFYHSRNRWLLLVKNHGLRTLLVSLPGILGYELVWLLFTLSRGHLGAHLQGKVSFFRSLGRALEARSEIQASRRVRDRDLLVGGPLTLSPELVQKASSRTFVGILDGWLRLWWGLLGRLAS
jgi:GT2 family glycosyltransferase/LmbE family N-acetylglucosaminyl deacetylase